MAGNLAMEKRGKAVGAIHIHALLMVVGQAGAHGRLVIDPAEQVFRSALGAAPNRRPDMAGKSATGIRRKGMSATRTRAPWTAVGVSGVLGLPVGKLVVVA